AALRYATTFWSFFLVTRKRLEVVAKPFFTKVSSKMIPVLKRSGIGVFPKTRLLSFTTAPAGWLVMSTETVSGFGGTGAGFGGVAAFGGSRLSGGGGAAATLTGSVFAFGGGGTGVRSGSGAGGVVGVAVGAGGFSSGVPSSSPITTSLGSATASAIR